MSVVLATAGYDHKIRFWEAPSGICSRIIKYPDSQVNRLQITPDKQFIAAAGNPVIRLYEILTATTPEIHPTCANNANNGAGTGTGASTTAGTPSGLSPGDQIPPLTQQAVLTLEGHTNNVTSLGFQKDGRYLYSGSEDGTIKIWDLRNPHYSRSFNVGSAVNSVTLRQDDSTGIDEFISGDYNGYVKIWDLGGAGSGGCINSLRPCAGSTIILSASANGAGGGSSCTGSDGGGDGGRPLSASSPSSPFDEAASSPSPLSGTQPSPAAVAAATRNNGTGDQQHKTKNKTSMATGTTNTTTTRRRHQYYSEGYAPIQSVDISEDSRTLVAISNHGTVFVWDPTARTASSAMAMPPSYLSSSPSPLPENPNDADDDDEDNENKNHMNGNNNHEDMEPKNNENGASTTNFGLDDDNDMMGGGVGSSSLLRPITKFRAHAPGIYCLHGKIAPDCRHLVTTGSDGTARLWDTATWDLTQTLHANHNNNGNNEGKNSSSSSSNTTKWVWDAAFCADSSYLMTASSDHVARLWNLRTGDVVRQYGHQSAVTCVALNDSSV